MKTQEKTIKVYYGLKWVKFKPITKEKYHRLKENSRLCFVKNAIHNYHIIYKICYQNLITNNLNL